MSPRIPLVDDPTVVRLGLPERLELAPTTEIVDESASEALRVDLVSVDERQDVYP